MLGVEVSILSAATNTGLLECLLSCITFIMYYCQGFYGSSMAIVNLEV